MSYTRVIPRDLFNEGKLLKCLGQLSLLILDEMGIRWPLHFEHDTRDQDSEDDRMGFVIERRDSDGGLYCDNLTLFCGKKKVFLYSALNSREPYPLFFGRGWNESEGDVFNNDGTLSSEFAEFLDKLMPPS